VVPDPLGVMGRIKGDEKRSVTKKKGDQFAKRLRGNIRRVHDEKKKKKKFPKKGGEKEKKLFGGGCAGLDPTKNKTKWGGGKKKTFPHVKKSCVLQRCHNS